MSYNPFTSVELAPDFNTGHVLLWKIDPAFVVSPDHSFTLEIAETPDFSELLYSVVADTDYFVKDTTKINQALGDNIVYRIRLFSGGQNYYSRTILFGSDKPTLHKYRIAAEITRKELLRMSRFTGQTGWLLKRRIYSQPKAIFIDEISGAAIADTSDDYGVGLVGGYHKPLAIVYGMEDNSGEKKFANEGYGVEENYTADIRMVGFPYVEPKDIIVDGTAGQRYNIITVKKLPFPGTQINVIQQISTKVIPNTDTIYQIPVPTK